MITEKILKQKSANLMGFTLEFSNPQFSEKSIARVSSEVDNCFLKPFSDKTTLLLASYYIYRGKLSGPLGKIIYAHIEEKIGESMYFKAKEMAGLFQSDIYEYCKILKDYYWGCKTLERKSLRRIVHFIDTCLPHMKDFFKDVLAESDSAIKR